MPTPSHKGPTPTMIVSYERPAASRQESAPWLSLNDWVISLVRNELMKQTARPENCYISLREFCFWPRCSMINHLAGWALDGMKIIAQRNLIFQTRRIIFNFSTVFVVRQIQSHFTEGCLRHRHNNFSDADFRFLLSTSCTYRVFYHWRLRCELFEFCFNADILRAIRATLWNGSEIFRVNSGRLQAYVISYKIPYIWPQIWKAQ